jgi:hypothetical protein
MAEDIGLGSLNLAYLLTALDEAFASNFDRILEILQGFRCKVVDFGVLSPRFCLGQRPLLSFLEGLDPNFALFTLSTYIC